MKVFQSRSFEKRVKKLSKQDKKVLDKNIRKILDNPLIGEEKRGDLRGVCVYKFMMKKTQYLLAYRFVNRDLELIMFGSHENYYRDLKTYLKRR